MRAAAVIAKDLRLAQRLKGEYTSDGLGRYKWRGSRRMFGDCVWLVVENEVWRRRGAILRI